MLIAFSGAQSSGKSTLLQECKKLDEFKDYTFVDEVTRRIKRNNNTEINNTASDYNYTQTLIIADHTKNATMSNTILDRCFLDGYVYTQYLRLYKHLHVKCMRITSVIMTLFFILIQIFHW